MKKTREASKYQRVCYDSALGGFEYSNSDTLIISSTDHFVFNTMGRYLLYLPGPKQADLEMDEKPLGIDSCLQT